MFVTKFASPQSTGFEFPHQSFDLLAASPLPNANLSDFRDANSAYLWQYSRPGGVVVFDFRMGRQRERPRRFLGNFEGILQSDGYAPYDHAGGPNIVHAACWAHARRKFFQE